MSHLILGNGLLGSEIRRQTDWRCLSHKEFDITQLTSLSELYGDIIINCTGYTKTYDNNDDKHYLINYASVKKLIDYCNETHKKLIHISTDYLYAGSVENATERDRLVPVSTWYGYYKLLADELVQLESEDFLICRGTHKPFPFPHPVAWTNQVGNFDYVNIMAKLIIKLIERGAHGVYNVGTERKSMYQLAQRTSDAKPIECPVPEVPKNVTMNLDKLKSVL